MAPLDRTQRVVLAGVVVGAFGLRAAWCLYAGGEPAGFHDPAFYRVLAHQLARFDGYILEERPTAYYPIGYPATLGAVYLAGRVVGLDSPHSEIVLANLLNLVAGTAAVVLAFVLGRRIAGAWAGVASAAVVGVMPNLVIHTAVPLTETLFNAVFLAFAVVIVGGLGPGDDDALSTRRLALAGALLGASALIRPVAAPVLPLLLLVWPSRLGLRRVALLALAAGIVILPWTVRNAVRMEAFVPISTNTGDNLCMSRQPGATGGFRLTDHCFGGPALEGLRRPEYEIERDAQGRRLALEFVREHPGREVGLWFSRLGATLRHDHDGLEAAESYGDDRFLSAGERDLYRRASDGAWYVLGVLGLAAAVGVVAIRRLRGDLGLRFLVVSAIGLLVPVVVFFGDARFKMPMVPVLAVLVCCVPAALRRRRLPLGDDRGGATGAGG